MNEAWREWQKSTPTIGAARRGLDTHTFLGKHKITELAHVLLVGLGIVLLDIFVNGTLGNFDCFLTRQICEMV